MEINYEFYFINIYLKCLFHTVILIPAIAIHRGEIIELLFTQQLTPLSVVLTERVLQG